MKPKTKFIITQEFNLYVKGILLKGGVQKFLGKLLDRGLIDKEEHSNALKYLETLAPLTPQK